MGGKFRLACIPPHEEAERKLHEDESNGEPVKEFGGRAVDLKRGCAVRALQPTGAELDFADELR